MKNEYENQTISITYKTGTIYFSILKNVGLAEQPISFLIPKTKVDTSCPTLKNVGQKTGQNAKSPVFNGLYTI